MRAHNRNSCRTIHFFYFHCGFVCVPLLFTSKCWVFSIFFSFFLLLCAGSVLADDSIIANNCVRQQCYCLSCCCHFVSCIHSIRVRSRTLSLNHIGLFIFVSGWEQNNDIIVVSKILLIHHHASVTHCRRPPRERTIFLLILKKFFFGFDWTFNGMANNDNNVSNNWPRVKSTSRQWSECVLDLI